MYIWWNKLFFVANKVITLGRHSNTTLLNVSIKVHLQQRDTNGCSQTIWFRDLQTDTYSRTGIHNCHESERKQNPVFASYRTQHRVNRSSPTFTTLTASCVIVAYPVICQASFGRRKSGHEYCMQKACSLSWKMQGEGFLRRPLGWSRATGICSCRNHSYTIRPLNKREE